MNLPAHPAHLYKWECPHCPYIVRTRLYDATHGCAISHCWSAHRMGTIGLPTMCLWDPRIVGKTRLETLRED